MIIKIYMRKDSVNWKSKPKVVVACNGISKLEEGCAKTKAGK